MGKRALWLLVVALMLISGMSLYAKGAQDEEAEMEVAAGEEGDPQYGGTLTLFNSGIEVQMLEPPNPSIEYSNYTSLWWLQFIQETPTYGDIMKGPRGTDEWAWQKWWWVPPEYTIGCLVESWEVTHEKLVFTVKSGINWAPTEHQSTFMEPREFTADDLAQDITRFWKSAWGARFEGMIADVYTAENTVVVEFENYSSALLYFIGYEDRALIQAPETVEAGSDRYENHVGTGPWMFDEYEIGSYMSFKRNPDYWDTTTIDGKEYKLPFIDRVIVPIIPDEATQYAALQTGKIDISRDTVASYWDQLDTRTPELVKTAYSIGKAHMLDVRNDQPPFDDVRVRRAVSLGIDSSEFRIAFKSEGLPVDFYPFVPGDPAYTPLEELPKDVQALYTYDPDEAKRLLKEAGYPNGFETEIIIEPSPIELDIASLIKDQLAKIGIDAKLNQVDEITYVAETYPLPVPKYKGMNLGSWSSSNPLRSFLTGFTIGGSGNTVIYANPEFDEIATAADMALDAAEATRLTKEAGAIIREDWPTVPLFFDGHRSYWWPWIKNYYGELSIADDASFAPVVKYMWLDLDLKKKMGF